MTNYSPIPKLAPSFIKNGVPRASTGLVFYGWLFLFTVPVTSPSNYAKEGKEATAFTSVAKP